jgi:F-type H+-transporting ATPase subunit delta
MPESQPLPSRVASVLEDPSAQALARVYADAFLDATAAADAATANALEELGSFVSDVIEKFPDFREVLVSRVVGRDDKIRLIDQVVAPRASELVTNFLRVLARHERLDLIDLIAREAKLRYEVRSGQRRVQVTSAREMNPGALARIRSRLAESLPFEPIVEPRVDPSLIGGLVIRVGDTVYDSSLAERVKQLRERLRQRSLHEIQSGRDRFSHQERD